jgi:hypothetical protein
MKLVKGDYVLATKYKDGDPSDHFAVGFFDGMIEDRFVVVDIGGVSLRGNGFRRCEKISGDVGARILFDINEIQEGTESLWGIKKRLEGATK